MPTTHHFSRFTYVVISAIDQPVRSRIARCLTSLAVPFKTVPPSHMSACDTRGALYCLDSRAFDSMPDSLRPIVVVTTGASISDESLRRASLAGLAVLPRAQLTPVTLLEALLRVTLGVGGCDVIDEIVERPPFRHVPRRIVEVILLKGARIGRPTDLCRYLGWTRRRLSAVGRRAGFARSDYLITALKTEAWLALVGRGIDPPAAENRLGIFHRPTFRRSCRRAGVMTPWERDRFGGSAG